MQIAHNVRWVVRLDAPEPSRAPVPVRVLQMEISDDHGVRRWVDVPEVKGE